MVAGVGYYCLSDYGVGPLIVDILAHTLRDVDSVLIEDLSYSAVAAFHRLREVDAERYVLVGSVKRGWDPGSIRVYHLPP
jgi:Ni,Fe-hydrogenase maturation factor